MPTPSPSGSRRASFLVVGGIAGALVLLGVVALVLMNRSEEKSSAPPDRVSGPSTDRALASSKAGVKVSPPPSTGDVAKSPEPERVEKAIASSSNPSFNPREEAAAKTLDQAKKYFKDHPTDPWSYRDQLDQVVSGHGATQAGQEARKLRDELQLPSELPPQDQEVLNEAHWKNAINLLAAPPLDPSRDGLAGTWELRDGGLVETARLEAARLALPYTPPDEYDVRIAFTRYEGDDAVMCLLSRQGRVFMFQAGGFGNATAGFEGFDGLSADRQPSSLRKPGMLTTGQKYLLVISVRADGVRAFLDSKKICQLSHDWRNVRRWDRYDFPAGREACLGLAAWQSAVRFDSVQVAEVTGQGTRLARQGGGTTSPVPAVKPVEPEAKAPTVVASVDPKAEYAKLIYEVLALLGQEQYPRAAARLEEAQKEPAFESLREVLKQDAGCVKLAEDMSKAFLAGIAKLKDGAAFVLRPKGKADIPVGAGNRNRVIGVKDDVLQIEMNITGGRLTLPLPIAQLTPENCYALSLLGLEGQENANLKEMMGGLVLWRKGAAKSPPRMSETVPEKDKVPGYAELSARARAWAALAEREAAADEAFKRAEPVIKDVRRFKEAKAALQKFKADFGNTVTALVTLQAKLAEYELAIVREDRVPGLWFGYWHSEGEQRFANFLTSAVETKLVKSWGSEPPRPDVPKESMAIRIRGAINIERDGHYQLVGKADDFMEVFLDDRSVLKLAFVGEPERTEKAGVQLTRGLHNLRIDFWQGGGNAGYSLKWIPPGANAEQEIPDALLMHSPTKDVQTR